jgi:hypothetical protein
MQLWLWEGLSPGQGKNRNIVEIWKLDSVKKNAIPISNFLGREQ